MQGAPSPQGLWPRAQAASAGPAEAEVPGGCGGAEDGGRAPGKGLEMH